MSPRHLARRAVEIRSAGTASAALLSVLVTVTAGLGGCRRPPRAPAIKDGGGVVLVPDGAAARAPAAPEARREPRRNLDALPEAPANLPEPRRALQVVDGRERVVDADGARATGLTLVDLSDDWAPAIFADGVGPDGAPLPNRYRAVFIGLGNDRTDGDGQPLGAGEKNYLELLGIPPSLSVLRARFLADAARSCAGVDNVKLLGVDEITTWGATTEQKEQTRHQLRGKRLEAARDQAGAADLAALASLDPKWARDVKAHARFAAERDAFAEVEKRVACEGLMDPARHRAGRYDTVMRAAVHAFQRKHAVMAEGDLNRATLEAMAKPVLALDYQALRRVLTERAVHAGGILEDGSAVGPDGAPATYPGRDGQRHPVPNLAAAATDRLLDALDLASPEDALGFFRRHAAGDFARLRVAVRFPEPPEYYGAGAPAGVSATAQKQPPAPPQLLAEIDRGDVWYDFPFDAKGTRLPQPRERFPTFTLYVKVGGERVPLVRWRTTIGGWRSELAFDGQEYYSFKISDVGPRVWRHVVTAPVWLPPATSPLASMVKEKRVNGSFIKVTNYDETGPGYLSAYGMVAAIHEQMRKGPNGATFTDNGIRTHGSFDYLSLRGRFSHGCHRLYNNLAVRLFSFILAHHRVRTLGPVALGFRRTFWWGGDLFDMRLPSRGFYFELDPPIPVETLEGRVRGERQTPVVGYVRKPGVSYPTEAPPTLMDTPESKAAGGDEP